MFLSSYTLYVHTPYNANQSNFRLSCSFRYIDHSEPVRNVRGIEPYCS